MKILIISDTHGQAACLEAIMQREKKIDLLLHAGDVEGEEDYIRTLVYSECRADSYIVSGNNDWFSDLPKEITVSVGDDRIFLCHGHRYGISFGTERIRDEARSRNATIIVAGHTHRPMVEKKDNILVVNPGSPVYPRQKGRAPTYAVMEIDQDHNVNVWIREL